MKGFALGLALKQRPKATQKSPIEPDGSTNYRYLGKEMDKHITYWVYQ